MKVGGVKGAVAIAPGGRNIRARIERKSKGIRKQAAKYPAVQHLMHDVNERRLMAEHHWKQSSKRETGIDGVGKAAYDESDQENITALVERMREFQYKPFPVRRTYTSKVDGKLRPLGIPAYGDHLVQGVMVEVLNEVYDLCFQECSYGFCLGKSAYDVERCGAPNTEFAYYLKQNYPKFCVNLLGGVE